MEETYRLTLEEKDEKINVIQTQVIHTYILAVHRCTLCVHYICIIIFKCML